MPRGLAEKIHGGAWLKRQIEDSGETQQAFAERSDICLETLRKWFAKPEPRPHGRLRSRLANALDISREDLDSWLAGIDPTS